MRKHADESGVVAASQKDMSLLFNKVFYIVTIP